MKTLKEISDLIDTYKNVMRKKVNDLQLDYKLEKAKSWFLGSPDTSLLKLPYFYTFSIIPFVLFMGVWLGISGAYSHDFCPLTPECYSRFEEFLPSHWIWLTGLLVAITTLLAGHHRSAATAYQIKTSRDFNHKKMFVEYMEKVRKELSNENVKAGFNPFKIYNRLFPNLELELSTKVHNEIYEITSPTLFRDTRGVQKYLETFQRDEEAVNALTDYLHDIVIYNRDINFKLMNSSIPADLTIIGILSTYMDFILITDEIFNVEGRGGPTGDKTIHKHIWTELIPSIIQDEILKNTINTRDAISDALQNRAEKKTR